MDSSKKIKVLFVCMGNICRSPLAEGVFKQHIAELNIADKFLVDSAGTASYHIGDCPDCRAIDVAKDLGVNLDHSARKFEKKDFANFDYIMVMDHLNHEAVLELSENDLDQEKVFLFRTFDSESTDFYNVPDPYYGSEDDFIEVGQIVSRASRGFIKFLQDSGKI